jgi:hypothetical protein
MTATTARNDTIAIYFPLAVGSFDRSESRFVARTKPIVLDSDVNAASSGLAVVVVVVVVDVENPSLPTFFRVVS